MKTEQILIYGGGALAVLYLLSKQSATTTTPATIPPGTLVTTPGAPAPPATYSQTYYEQYEYPAMLKANPNVGNPSYTLTQDEANQYFLNYSGVSQWATESVPSQFSDRLSAARFHWQHYGPQEKRTFLPLMPQDLTPYIEPPKNPNTSGGGSSTVSTVLGIATTVLGFLGTNDPLLNDAEAETLITGSAVMTGLLPFYYGEPNQLAFKIEDRMNALLKQYTANM